MIDEQLNIMFLNYGPYSGCSGVHIHFLAKTLVNLGHKCTVFLPNTTGAKDYFGKVNYPIYSFGEMLDLPLDYFDNGVLHVWTTREPVRVPTEVLRRRVKLPYLVHLEDNEVLMTGQSINVFNFADQKTYAENNPQAFEKFLHTHPLQFERFMIRSNGVTCIIKELEEFVPQNVPRMTFWPACEEEFFNIPMQRHMALRNAFEVSDDTYMLLYPGAVHAFNVQHFIELLLAIDKLNEQGFSVKLVRTGIEYDAYSHEILELYKKHVIYVEDLSSAELPRLMAIADILVQPGHPGDFDNFRFPSKIPFFLASGRPVILPNTNVASSLTHGHDCFLTKTGSSEEIAKYLQMLMTHPELAKSIGTQGRATARKLFSWTKAAQSLIPHYKRAVLAK